MNVTGVQTCALPISIVRKAKTMPVAQSLVNPEGLILKARVAYGSLEIVVREAGTAGRGRYARGDKSRSLVYPIGGYDVARELSARISTAGKRCGCSRIVDRIRIVGKISEMLLSGR